MRKFWNILRRVHTGVDRGEMPMSLIMCSWNCTAMICRSALNHTNHSRNTYEITYASMLIHSTRCAAPPAPVPSSTSDTLAAMVSVSMMSTSASDTAWNAIAPYIFHFSAPSTERRVIFHPLAMSISVSYHAHVYRKPSAAPTGTEFMSRCAIRAPARFSV